MAYQEQEPKRLYWRMGEVSSMLNVSPSTIRYWLSYFGYDISKRSPKRNRLFNKKEVITMKVIYYLVYIEQYTLPGAKAKFNLWISGDYEIPEERLIL